MLHDLRYTVRNSKLAVLGCFQVCNLMKPIKCSVTRFPHL